MLHLLAAAVLAASPAPSKIVFSSTRDGTTDLYALAPAGGRIARITDGADIAEPERIVVSRDGTVVAYPRSDGKVDVVGTDGRPRGTIDCRYGRFGVSLAPNGRQVVCMTAYQILSVVDLDGGAARTVATGSDPAWSSDGRTIAFVDETEHVSVVAAAGGQPRRLSTRRADFLTELAWSPDSRGIAFVGDSTSGAANLVVVAADGRDERVLARRAAGPVSWSPSGTRIAAQDTRRRQIVIVDVRTGARRQLTHERAEAASPAWSPSGQRLAYLTGRRPADKEAELFTIAADGSGRRRLTSPFRGGAIPRTSWAPGPLERGIRPPRVAVAHLAGDRQLALGGTLDRVVTDGPRAATSVAFDCVSVIWNVLTPRREAIRSCFADDVDSEPMYEIALSGTRFAWLQLCSCRYGAYNELHVKGPRESASFGSAIDRQTGAGVLLRNLAGDRGLLAFNARVVTPKAPDERRLWVIPSAGAETGPCPAPGARICRRLTSGDGADVLDVDAGRILAARRDGTLLLLADDDRVLRTWSLRPGEVTGAQVTGGDVVVTTARELRLYDAASGTLKKTRLLPLDVVTPRLVDAAVGFALYVRGGALHIVRLADGRDVAVYAPRQAEVVSGRLERTGLVYLYNRLGARRPGRIAYVPLARLRRLVATAG